MWLAEKLDWKGLKENLSQCHLPTTNHKQTDQTLNQASWMRG
jgi:hypothetical protein